MELTLGQYLREIRLSRNETLHQVAIGTNIDSPLINKIERGRRLPTVGQISRIASFFKISETDLKIKHTAEKILRDFGESEITYQAIQLVKKQLKTYSKNKREG